jgi:hypothetical protein
MLVRIPDSGADRSADHRSAGGLAFPARADLERFRRPQSDAPLVAAVFSTHHVGTRLQGQHLADQRLGTELRRNDPNPTADDDGACRVVSSGIGVLLGEQRRAWQAECRDPIQRQASEERSPCSISM